MDAKARIDELRKQIEYHSNRYYNEDNPEISDYEFDQMMQELKRLEQEHPQYASGDSPTQKVGGGEGKAPGRRLSSPQCADVKPSGRVFKGRGH